MFIAEALLFTIHNLVYGVYIHFTGDCGTDDTHYGILTLVRDGHYSNMQHTLSC